MDRRTRADRLALADRLRAGVGGAKAKQAETDAERKARMASKLLAVVDTAVGQAEKFSDPTKVSVALGNASKALELAEKLAPTQAAAMGHTVLVQMPQDDDADGDPAADAQDSVQQAPG